MNSADRVVLAIETVDLVKVFDHGAIRALDGVNLSVRRGEWVAVVGHSGSGKSTLLHLLAALDAPTAGRILVNGRDLHGRHNLDRYRRLEVGLVFQLHNLLPNLTSLQNIEVAMLGNGLRHREQRARAHALLAEFGLSDKERVPPPRLSGGMRQRLAIARALANEPSLILADEPTGNLDPEGVTAALALFRRIRDERGTTIVLVSHNPSVAAAADRIVTLQRGRIATEQPAGAHPINHPDGTAQEYAQVDIEGAIDAW